MYTLFLQFLTDYSGIDSAVGKVGFAAGFGTVILLITRIIDGIDDPIQAYLIDGAKETRFGKYRKFTIIGIIAIALGLRDDHDPHHAHVDRVLRLCRVHGQAQYIGAGVLR